MLGLIAEEMVAMRIFVLTTMATLLLATAPAMSEEPEANGVVRATGIGRPPQGRSPVVSRLMARRAAEVVAVRNLALKLSGGQPGGPVPAKIAGFRYLEPVYRADGTIEVTVEMPEAATPR